MSSSSIQTSNSLEEEVRAVGYATLANKSLKTLTERELRLVHRIICIRNPERYTIRKLFDDYWEDVLSKRSFGRRFRRAVDEGLIVGLAMRERNPSRSRVYEVFPPRVAANDGLAQRSA